MSQRGNQDHFKISSSQTDHRDLARMAHQSLAAEQAKQRHSEKGAPVGAVQAAAVHLAPPPKFKKPGKREKPSTSHAQGTLGPIGEVTMPGSHVGFHVPTFGEAAKMAVSGAWKLGSWAVGLTLQYGGRSILRRFERIFGGDDRQAESEGGIPADRFPSAI